MFPLPKNHKKFFCEVTSNRNLKLLRILLLDTPRNLCNRPLSRRLDRCDRVIQNESRDPFGGNVYYVTMQITFLTRKFRNGERNLHCDVVHVTTKWVPSLTLDCNGVFAIKAYHLLLVGILSFCGKLGNGITFW